MKRKMSKKHGQKIGYCIIFFLLSFCIFGCAKNSNEVSGYQISYKSEDGLKLTELNYVPEAEGGETLVNELLDRISNPSSISVQSCIPESVSILDFQLKGQHLKVNLNNGYSTLDHVSQVLLRAAIVKTLVQMPEVSDVSFNIEGKAMLDQKGNEVGAMDASSFIDTEGEGINSYQFAALTLYFSNQEGDRIVKEMRNVYYSSNTSLEKVVVEQLKSGPVNDQLSPVIPDTSKIIDVSINKNVCTVNFDEEFNREIPNSKTKPATAIYAIVNALCDVCDVSEVQILIEGESNVLYRESVNLSEPFKRNKNIILTVENTEETTRETITEEQKKEPTLGVDPILKENSESDKKGE